MCVGLNIYIDDNLMFTEWGIIPAKQGWACDVKKARISFTSEAEVGFRAKNRYHFLLMGTCLQPALTNSQINLKTSELLC